MKKFACGLACVAIVAFSLTPVFVDDAQAVVTLDCDEYFNGGGNGLDCVDSVIFMHNSVSGPWDGDLEGDGWW